MYRIIGEIVFKTLVAGAGIVIFNAILGNHNNYPWYVWLSTGIMSGAISNIYWNTL